jgi:uncharacterized Fe-S cluster protein YjdI
MERKITKKYDNGEITVIWQPHKCIHSAICFRGLPAVFDPRKRPWVNEKGASSEAIMKQVDQCPSSALSYLVHEREEVGGANSVRSENKSA